MVSVLRRGFQFVIRFLYMMFGCFSMSTQLVFVFALRFVSFAPSLHQMLLRFSKIGMAMRIDVFDGSLGTEHSSTK